MANPIVPTLRGVNLKMNRAGEHLQILNEEIGAFLEAKMHRILEDVHVTEPEPYSGEPVYEFESPPVPERWSVLIGDFAYNLRSCLDHLVNQLAIMNNPVKLSESQFPICELERSFSGQGLKKIRHLSKAHIAVITDFQPYPGGAHAAANQPLLSLNKLRNIDAHQEVHTTAVKFEIPKQQFTSIRRVAEGVWEVGLRDLNPKKLRVRLDTGDTLQLHTQVKGKFPTQVVFDEATTPILHGKDVLELLNAMRTRVADVVNQFSPSFS